MFGPVVRLLLGASALALGVVHIARGNPTGWIAVGIAVLLAYGYFRYGTVWLAFQAYRRADIDGIERRLRQVLAPGMLRAQDRVYYEFLAGIVAHRNGDFAAAREHLIAAANGPLRTDNLRSTVQCHLAQVATDSGDAAAARLHVEAARRIPHSTALDRLITELEAKLAD